MPLMAPPPLGKLIEGTSIALDLVSPPSVLRKEEEAFLLSGDVFICFLDGLAFYTTIGAIFGVFTIFGRGLASLYIYYA